MDNNLKNNQNTGPSNQANSDFSDKHKDFMAKYPTFPFANPSPAGQNTNVYLNPNNYTDSKQNPVPAPTSPISQPPVQSSPVLSSPSNSTETSVNTVRSVPVKPYNVRKDVEKTVQRDEDLNNTHRYAIMKLIIYMVPIIGIFILIFKSVRNKVVLWHVRQSLVAQGIWFLILIILRYLDLPIISDQGKTLWNFACYILLVIAGVYAYNGDIFKIPVVYDIAKGFIEEEDPE